MSKKTVFQAFRWVASKASGRGLRRRFPLVNSLYTKLNSRLSPSRVKVLGHEMILDRGDSMGLALSGIYEPVETQIILENVKPGQTVVDIGANIGYYTLILARAVGDRGKVFAFEPDPLSFGLLRRNIAANGYKNTVLEQKIVSDHTGQAYLQLDKFNNLDHRAVFESAAAHDVAVKAVSLDDYFGDSPQTIDFIKMDVQGAESLVLRGMRQLVKRSRGTKILTEFWPIGLDRMGTAAAYLKELADLGFSFIDIGAPSGSGNITRSLAELLEMYPSTSSGYTNLLCVRRDE